MRAVVLEPEADKDLSVEEDVVGDPVGPTVRGDRLADQTEDGQPADSRVGAEGGIRTPTLLRAPAPQAGASASSATSASEG